MMFEVDGRKVAPVEGEVDKRLQMAVASIFDNRLPVFLPMKSLEKSRIKKIFDRNDGVISMNTPYGEIELRARLITQYHKEFLEAMLSYEKHLLADGSFYVEFKIYDLLKNKLKKPNPTGYEVFRKYLKELKDFNISITAGDVEIGFGFIDDWKIETVKGKRGRPAQKYQVKFTRALSLIWQNENLLDYKRTLGDMPDDPVISAMIRYLITYYNISYSVRKLAITLGFDKFFGRTRYFEVLDEIRESFSLAQYVPIYEKFGISYDEEADTITINRQNAFMIHSPKGKKTISAKLIAKQKSLFD